MNTRRALFIGLLLLPGWAFAQQEHPQSVPEALFKAVLLDPAGQPTTLTRFRGRPLIVNFWARWCGPCRVEIPEIVAQYPQAKDAGVQIVGIALDDKPDAVRDYAKAYDMDYPILLAKGKELDLLRQLGNPEVGLPYTLIIDRSGKIAWRKLGAMSRAELRVALDIAGK